MMMDGASIIEQPPSKEIPDQNVLANGTKVSPRSPLSSPRSLLRGLTKTSSSGPEINANSRRNRSITLSVSATNITIDKTITERRARFARDRSNSEPLKPDFLGLSIDEIWDETEANWDEVRAQKGRLISLLYKKGIPNNRRGKLWTKLSKIIPNTDLLKCSQEEESGVEHRCIYKRLLELNNTPHEQQIRADITRTFPSEKSIYVPEFQQSLFNVLKAFSLYDEEVGYCQGLSFVAALLLMQVQEEQAFFMLIRLLKGHNLRSFYTEDMKGVRMRMFQMNKITQTLFPRMYKHMEELGVSVAVVTTPWFMTAFGYQLPLEVALRVTDALLFEGIPALFRIALAILVLCEQEILDLGVDGVMDYFRSDLRAKFQDPQLLMTTAYTVNVSLSQLESLEFEFLKNEAVADRVENEFSQNSEEEEYEKKNTLRYSAVLVDSHELKEKLVRKNNEHDRLAKEFEAYRKKAENEKIALVTRLGKLLDRVNNVEAENELLSAKLMRAEAELKTTGLQCNQLMDCNRILSEELYKLKKKNGGDIITIIKRGSM